MPFVESATVSLRIRPKSDSTALDLSAAQQWPLNSFSCTVALKQSLCDKAQPDRMNQRETEQQAVQFLGQCRAGPWLSSSAQAWRGRPVKRIGQVSLLWQGIPKRSDQRVLKQHTQRDSDTTRLSSTSIFLWGKSAEFSQDALQRSSQQRSTRSVRSEQGKKEPGQELVMLKKRIQEGRPVSKRLVAAARSSPKERNGRAVGAMARSRHGQPARHKTRESQPGVVQPCVGIPSKSPAQKLPRAFN